jgi:hypothetical protein
MQSNYGRAVPMKIILACIVLVIAILPSDFVSKMLDLI